MSDRTDRDLAELTERWSDAAQAYLDGDLPRYAALANHAPDFTLTPPLGGDPRDGFDGSDQAPKGSTYPRTARKSGWPTPGTARSRSSTRAAGRS